MASRVLNTLCAAQGAGGAHAVVFLWPAATKRGRERATRATPYETEELLRRCFNLCQALLTARPVPFWIVTRGAAVRAPQGEVIRTPNAGEMQALWGMARVLGAEAGSVGGRVVDLCPCDPDASEEAASLLAELAASAGQAEAHVESAWRRRARYVPRLAAAVVGKARATPLQPERRYVLAGGLGGLGINLTANMVRTC